MGILNSAMDLVVGLLMLGAVAIVLSIVAHLCIRRWWLASMAATVISWLFSVGLVFYAEMYFDLTGWFLAGGAELSVKYAASVFVGSTILGAILRTFRKEVDALPQE
jgi:hypothetical protein